MILLTSGQRIFRMLLNNDKRGKSTLLSQNNWITRALFLQQQILHIPQVNVSPVVSKLSKKFCFKKYTNRSLFSSVVASPHLSSGRFCMELLFDKNILNQSNFFSIKSIRRRVYFLQLWHHCTYRLRDVYGILIFSSGNILNQSDFFLQKVFEPEFIFSVVASLHLSSARFYMEFLFL